jgi:hypothetical protein
MKRIAEEAPAVCCIFVAPSSKKCLQFTAKLNCSNATGVHSGPNTLIHIDQSRISKRRAWTSAHDGSGP